MRDGIRSLAVLAFSIALCAALAWSVSGVTVEFLGFRASWLAAAAAVVVNLVAWVPASALKTERFYDLTGTATFSVVVALDLVAAHSAGVLDATGLVTAAMVLVWTLRLGSFLVGRVRQAGKDGRFDTLKRSPATFLVPWALQAAWVFVTSLAAQVVIASSIPRTGVHPLFVAGVVVWVAGFTLEVVADRQKARFSADPSNHGRFITTGLWGIVRHPNYLGEITLWSGVALASLPSVQGAAYAVLVSPLLVFVLLRFVSGIPLLEARAKERWGDDPAYREHLARVPRLLPFTKP